MRIALTLINLLFLTPFAWGQVHVGLMGGGGFWGDVEVRGAIPVMITKNDFVSFQSELAYTIRGNREILRRVEIEPELSAERLFYLELPISVKWRLPLEKIQPYLLTGIQVGYGVGVRVKYVESQSYYNWKTDFSNLQLKSWDGGMNLGIGVEKATEKDRRIYISYRYYLGLVDFEENEEGELYNSGGYFSIGFMVPLAENGKRR